MRTATSLLAATMFLSQFGAWAHALEHSLDPTGRLPCFSCLVSPTLDSASDATVYVQQTGGSYDAPESRPAAPIFPATPPRPQQRAPPVLN